MERPGIFKASLKNDASLKTELLLVLPHPILSGISYGCVFLEDPSRGRGAWTSYQHPGRRCLVRLQALS